MDQEAEIPFDETLHASAVHFLLSAGENEAALILLSLTVEIDTQSTHLDEYALNLHLKGPRDVYEIIKDNKHPITESIEHAFDAVLPGKTYVSELIASANLIAVEPDWKEKLSAIAQGKDVTNQGVPIQNRPAPILWKNLRFRSETERRIAEALEKARVLFLPNCLARLNTEEGPKTREADFIVCYNGKWGILEVDGGPYHPPSRTTEDHERDRIFLAHGIPIVLHYDAEECYHNPEKVVRNFLGILRGREK